MVMQHHSVIIPFYPPEHHIVISVGHWCGMEIKITSKHEITESWDGTHDCPGGYEHEEKGIVESIEICLDNNELYNAFNGFYDEPLNAYVERVTGCEVPADVEIC